MDLTEQSGSSAYWRFHNSNPTSYWVAHDCRTCRQRIHFCVYETRCCLRRSQCTSCREDCIREIDLCCHDSVPKELIEILSDAYDLTERLNY